MPELSRFDGIIVKMLFNDTAQHNKPHVHVYYGDNVNHLKEKNLSVSFADSSPYEGEPRG